MNIIPQSELDRLAKLAAFIAHAPVSLISIAGSDGQMYFTRLGPDNGETTLEASFCQDFGKLEKPSFIDDTIKAAEYKNSKYVISPPFIRAFAAVPVISVNGETIGNIYVLDKEPRIFTEEQRNALLTLSEDIASRFDAHKKAHQNTAEQDLVDYKYALDQSSMVSIFGIDGKITYVNDKFCEVSKHTADEIIGQDHRILNPDLHSKEFIKDLWNAIAAGRIFQSEFRNKAKDGSLFWVSSTIIPFFDKNGKPYKYLSISYDVTQKKLQEEQLIQVKVLAEKLAKSKDIFLTNMSHEIRTPLNAITGLSKLLGKTELDEQQINYVSGIQSASDNLLSVINDLLDFSKIEAGKITIEQISFNLRSICEQAVNILSHKAEEKGLELKCDIDDRIAPVLIGDPYRINQVFMNMVGNAIKFTEQGHVHLDARLLEETNNSQKILVTIADTGVGISEEYLQSIFDKFTQEDETVVRKFGGTGLGMSITKELMELMNGNISITSQKNKGTTVSLEFTFNIGTARVFEKKRTVRVDTGIINNKHILLVEDNNLNRLLAKTILTGYGARITEAENGQIAVDMMRKGGFDLVLMDIQMPVMDGIKATQIIRAEIDDSIPILALSANAIKGKLEQFLDAGMDDYIFKPYDELKLVTPIAKWLKKNTGESVKRAEAVESVASADSATEDEITYPLYDLSKLKAMSGDNDDFISKMLQLFITEIPPSIEKINEAYAAADMETVKYYAHMLKPSMSNLSITNILHEVIQLESMAARGERGAEVERIIKKLGKVTAMVVDQMKKEHSIAD